MACLRIYPRDKTIKTAEDWCTSVQPYFNSGRIEGNLKAVVLQETLSAPIPTKAT